MRAILIIAIVVLAMIALGWLSFHGGSDRATMTIETQKMEQDTERAVEKGREAIRDAKQELRDEPVIQP
jgi:Tfp pilus assembly protein PilV